MTTKIDSTTATQAELELWLAEQASPCLDCAMAVLNGQNDNLTIQALRDKQTRECKCHGTGQVPRFPEFRKPCVHYDAFQVVMAGGPKSCNCDKRGWVPDITEAKLWSYMFHVYHDPMYIIQLFHAQTLTHFHGWGSTALCAMMWALVAEVKDLAGEKT